MEGDSKIDKPAFIITILDWSWRSTVVTEKLDIALISNNGDKSDALQCLVNSCGGEWLKQDPERALGNCFSNQKLFLLPNYEQVLVEYWDIL